MGREREDRGEEALAAVFRPPEEAGPETGSGCALGAMVGSVIGLAASIALVVCLVVGARQAVVVAAGVGLIGLLVGVVLGLLALWRMHTGRVGDRDRGMAIGAVVLAALPLYPLAQYALTRLVELGL